MRVRSYPWKLGTNQEMTQDVYIILYLYEVHEAVEDIGLQWIDGVGISSKIRIVFWHVNHSDDTWWRCEILWLWYDDHGWDWNSKTKTSRRKKCWHFVDLILYITNQKDDMNFRPKGDVVINKQMGMDNKRWHWTKRSWVEPQSFQGFGRLELLYTDQSDFHESWGASICWPTWKRFRFSTNQNG